MGLQIERKVAEDFFVGGEQFAVTAIHSKTACCIQRMRDGALFDLVYDSWREIAPGVKVCVGERGQLHMTRIAFTADRSIPIVRGELYRA